MELESRQRAISHATLVNPAQPLMSAFPQIPITESVNLPKLHLSSYIAQYLSKANKFRHLKTLLEGKAASTISGIQATETNYDTAVEVLKETFSRKPIYCQFAYGSTNEPAECSFGKRHYESKKTYR